MLEEESVQVPFNYKDENGNIIFRDALVFTASEFRNTSREEREVMMEERYNNWLVVRSTPAEEPTPPEEG